MITAFVRWQIDMNPIPYSCESQSGTLLLFDIIPLTDVAR
jgi:hypothetical protein